MTPLTYPPGKGSYGARIGDLGKQVLVPQDAHSAKMTTMSLLTFSHKQLCRNEALACLIFRRILW